MITPDEIDNAKLLVESIVRREFGPDWGNVVRNIEFGAMDNENEFDRKVTAHVATGDQLELIDEQLVSAFQFNTARSEVSVVSGRQNGDWLVTRAWLVIVKDADKNAGSIYPGFTPPGVRLIFSYAETRPAKLEDRL